MPPSRVSGATLPGAQRVGNVLQNVVSSVSFKDGSGSRFHDFFHEIWG